MYIIKWKCWLALLTTISTVEHRRVNTHLRGDVQRERRRERTAALHAQNRDNTWMMGTNSTGDIYRPPNSQYVRCLCRLLLCLDWCEWKCVYFGSASGAVVVVIDCVSFLTFAFSLFTRFFSSLQPTSLFAGISISICWCIKSEVAFWPNLIEYIPQVRIYDIGTEENTVCNIGHIAP